MTSLSPIQNGGSYQLLALVGETGETEQFKAMDRLILRCKVRQESQMQPGVRIREKRRSRCYPLSTFRILLPTEFLRASSA